MKRLTALVVSLLFLILSSCELTETEINIFNKQISFEVTDHILQDYYIYSIAFEENGTAWIGTFYGELIKYDGTVTIYNSINSVFSSNKPVYDICVDRNNNIWIACEIGLVKYDHVNFTIYNSSNSPIVRENIRALAVDNDNSVWFNCGNVNDGGLMCFHENNWTFYTPENSMLPSRWVQDITIDNSNSVWIALNNGLGNPQVLRIKDAQWRVFDKIDFGFEPYLFKYIKCDNHDNIYVSLDYGLSSLYDITRPNVVKYNGGSWEIFNPVNEHGESLGYVWTITCDKRGYLWTSTWRHNNDYYVAVNKENRWEYTDSLLTNDVSIVMESNASNTIWIGTGNGIYLINQ